jgi:hypothetical protein
MTLFVMGSLGCGTKYDDKCRVTLVPIVIRWQESESEYVSLYSLQD